MEKFADELSSNDEYLESFSFEINSPKTTNCVS